MKRNFLDRRLRASCLLTTLSLCACSSGTNASAGNGGAGGLGSGGAGGKGGGPSLSLFAVSNAEDDFPVPKAEGLAPTPPMGWNSWNSYASSVSAELVMKVADILAE